MRDANRLEMSAALSAALVVLVIAASASAQAQPSWRPPPPIIPVFGARASAPTPAPPAPPDVRLNASHVAVHAMFAASFPEVSSLDSALVSRGYSAGDVALGFDLALTYRAIWWLFVGARTGARWRSLSAGAGGRLSDDVQLSGLDLLAVAELRIPFGALELTPDFAAGIAYVEIGQGTGSVARAAPRLSFGGSVSIWVVEPIRVLARLAWDVYPVVDVNRYGHDINLGGPSIEFGIEWRPR